MGWVEDEYQNRSRGEQRHAAEAPPEVQLESRERRKWRELTQGLEQDVSEYQRVGGNASFQNVTDSQVRVSNARSGVAVVLTADLDANMIHYSYEPESERTAVPEGGVLSLRSSNGDVDVYSSDQRLSSDEARRLVLEPLLFPRAPLEGLEPTGT